MFSVFGNNAHIFISSCDSLFLDRPLDCDTECSSILEKFVEFHAYFFLPVNFWMQNNTFMEFFPCDDDSLSQALVSTKLMCVHVRSHFF